jgi:hypothetical protein
MSAQWSVAKAHIKLPTAGEPDSGLKQLQGEVFGAGPVTSRESSRIELERDTGAASAFQIPALIADSIPCGVHW